MKAVAAHFPTFANFWARLSAVNYRRIARRCLVFLAVVAVVGAASSGAFCNYQRCMQTAFSMELGGGCLVARKGGNLTPREREWVRWCTRMESKYRTAAWVPLLLLVPDPAKPRL